MSKLIITRKDGSTVDVEPNKMWEPRTDAELVEVLRGEVERLTAELKEAQAENAKLREISALVSQRHGDDDAFGEDEDDENDLPVVITMKRIFKILDGRIYE